MTATSLFLMQNTVIVRNVSKVNQNITLKNNKYCCFERKPGSATNMLSKKLVVVAVYWLLYSLWNKLG